MVLDKTRWWVLLYIGTLTFLSLNPWFKPSSELVMGHLAWDKLAHGAAYALLAWLLLLTGSHKPHWLNTVKVFMLCAIAGIAFECGQYWLTYSRQFSCADAIANVCGAMVGIMLFIGCGYVTKAVNVKC